MVVCVHIVRGIYYVGMCVRICCVGNIWWYVYILYDEHNIVVCLYYSLGIM